MKAITGKRIVTLYMQALGDSKIPVSVWKKIARVNQIILDNIKESKEKEIWNGLCNCGHWYDQHGLSFSINYSAGACKEKNCKCSAFICRNEKK